MPTILTHAIVPVALGLGLGPKTIPPRLLIAGALAAMIADADVVAFKFGIAYADAFGHRGASHSLVFACLLGAATALLHSRLRSGAWTAFWFVTIATASHPLLDMLTDGGLGVALRWPWSEARHFAPWRPIEVSPFAHNFFSARGVDVLLSELRWVWLPTLAGSAVLAGMRRLITQGTQQAHL
jgi:inner membrane protein